VVRRGCGNAAAKGAVYPAGLVGEGERTGLRTAGVWRRGRGEADVRLSLKAAEDRPFQGAGSGLADWGDPEVAGGQPPPRELGGGVETAQPVLDLEAAGAVGGVPDRVVRRGRVAHGVGDVGHDAGYADGPRRAALGDDADLELDGVGGLALAEGDAGEEGDRE